MKLITKTTAALTLVLSFISSVASPTYSRFVYGPHCIGHSAEGKINCDGWTVTLITEGKGDLVNSNLYPALSVIIANKQPITDGMLFPTLPSQAFAVSPAGRDNFIPVYDTQITITDPTGKPKTFQYLPNKNGPNKKGGFDAFFPYIQHSDEPKTGGAQLNEPEDGSVTIDSTSW